MKPVVPFNCLLFLVVLLAPPACLAATTDATPWRLARAAGLPEWLHLSGSHRTRYESQDGRYRAGRDGGDQVVALRTLLLTELRFDSIRVGGEFIDSRAMLDDSGTSVSTTVVNPVELLQGYLAWDTTDLINKGDRSTVRAGRLTLDVGSRRIVARSVYRNTINTFTGIEWRWHGAAGNDLQAFYTLPVNRKPNTRMRLLDDAIEFDEEDVEVRFWGVLYGLPLTAGKDRAEFYFLGLDEDDSDGRPTRNRELYMPGLRVLRKPVPGHFDYTIESVLQFGESRADAATTTTTDLDHFAHFHHAEIGYSFDVTWSPRLIVQYDYASGDADPTDGANGQFDTLFGARRFEYGPTGIFGPFIRRNINTPGVRIKLKPARGVTMFMSHRGFWLASERDVWPTAGVRDPSGNSGSFIGQQFEMRVRFEVVPNNYRFEAGLAHIFDGEFMRDAPNANNSGDVTYLYTQVLLTF